MADGWSVLDPLSGAIDRDLVSDASWVRTMVDVELSITRALVAAAVAPNWMLEVCDALGSDELLETGGPFEPASLAAAARGGGNPVIPLASALSKRGESMHAGASDYLHVGATSQDILDTASMVIAGRVIDALRARLSSFSESIAALADSHRNTPMAARTLGQQASPTTFGLVAAGWLAAALDVSAQLATTRSRLPLQYFGAVGTSAVLTDKLRMSGTSVSARDIQTSVADALGLVVTAASWQTDRRAISMLGADLAAAIGVVGKFALDVTVLSRTEIAEVSERLGDGEGGSSAMPHKRNPVTSVLIVSAARQSPALASTLFGSMLAEDQRPTGAWHAEWETLRRLEQLALEATAAAASLASRLDVDAERMLQNLELTGGLVHSERVLTVLASALTSAAARDIVERASRDAVRTRRPLRIALAALLADELHDDDLRGRVWNAFDDSATVDDSIIDRVLAAHESSRS